MIIKREWMPYWKALRKNKTGLDPSKSQNSFLFKTVFRETKTVLKNEDD